MSDQALAGPPLAVRAFGVPHRGDAFKAWVAANDQRHHELMKEAGFLAPGK